MILHGGIRLEKVFGGSWLFLTVVTGWTLLVVFLDEVLDLKFIGHPTPLVTTVGIAVSLYLGFKNTSSFARWWEARNIWGEIVNFSRDWGNSVNNLMVSEGQQIDPEARERLILHHVAWINMLAYQLRLRNPTSRARVKWMFGLNSLSGRHELHQTDSSFLAFLSAQDAAKLDGKANRASYILFQQGQHLRALAEQGCLDSYRHVAMMDRLGRFHEAQGKCERLKNTPFPRQIADIGRVLTWIFIFMLPLAFVDLYSAADELEGLARWFSINYAAAMVPFCVLVCWVFFLTEKVSVSMEDPFDGEASDVPISTIARMIEIDLRQMLDHQDIPSPLPPIGLVAY